MTEFNDISGWNLQHWNKPNKGSRPNDIYERPEDGQLFYFKQSKSVFPTEVWSEVISSKIGQYLGFYKNGIKIGVWDYSNKDGLEQRFDYTGDSIVFTTSLKIRDTILYVKTNAGFISRRVDSPPIFKEGESAKKKYMFDVNNYYGYSLPKKIWISSTIQFEIDENGIALNHLIVEGEYSEYNQNALKVVKAIPNEWIPAKLNGKSVTSLWTITTTNQYIDK